MKIDHAMIQYAAGHAAERAQAQSSRLEAWVGARRPQDDASSGADTLILSDAARRLLATPDQETAGADAAQAVADDPVDTDPKLQLLKMVVETLSGRKIRVMQAKDLQPQSTAAPAATTETPAATAPAAAGYGLAFDYHQSYFESETLSFSAEGYIKTADGATVPFRVELEMHREFSAQLDLSIREGDAQLTDPLVVNFNGALSALSSMSFTFDLNADGDAEQVALPGAGSGLLALDRNGDGKITNGNELFGPRSGDAFAELAGYDDDGNGWIDEADAVFDQLRVWVKDAEKDRLFSLREQDIGALYLGHARTPFDLKDNANALLGQVRSTGLYVKNDYTLGSLQQIDLAAQPAAPPDETA